MEITIRVHRKFSSRVDRTRLRRIVKRALAAEKSRGDLAVYATTDTEIRLLNRKFHATNAPTDVLSFPSLLKMDLSLRGVPATKQSPARSKKRNSRRRQLEDGVAYLGDIVISYDRARIQARAVGWRISDELELLALHGALHLLGYDDRKQQSRKRMWKRQEEILQQVKK